MTDQPVPALLTALDIVAFELAAGSGFRLLATPPQWFGRLSRDGTFPFLGHILEEARAFWDSHTQGVRQWGPTATTADDGSEFHYLVKAVNVGARSYLVFQLDESAERMRDILQKVRADALAASQNPSQH